MSSAAPVMSSAFNVKSSVGWETRTCAKCGNPRHMPADATVCAFCEPGLVGRLRTLALPGLRSARLVTGLSQRKLAGASGMTQFNVSCLERGLTFARPITAKALADALETTVDELRRGA